MVAGIYRYVTGAAWGREFIATGLGQGNESILTEPRGTRRVDAINNLDLRAEKTIPLGAKSRVGIIADIFNVTNQGVPDSDWVAPVRYACLVRRWVCHLCGGRRGSSGS